MDIGKGNGYPAGNLSNFSPHPFVFDGVECASMEGLLQAFKFPEESIQREVCSLVGYVAKKRGSNKNWQRTQTLYWKGVQYIRNSKEYQLLLDRAYDALSTNDSFRRALLASGSAVLKHSIGRTKQSETVLTQQEFCSRLMKIRERLKNDSNGKGRI